MIDSHSEYNHGEQSDHRRWYVPPSSSYATYDFRPAPKSRKDTPVWVALLALIGGPAVMFFAWIMTQ